MSISDLARELRPGNTVSDAPTMLSDIVSSVNLADRPPTLTLATRGPTAFSGLPRDYHVGDVVQYIPNGPGSLVVGKLPCRGYGPVLEDPDEAEEVEPWNEVGAVGQPAFGGAWVNFAGVDDHDTAAFYRQMDYWVRLKGLVKSGAVGSTIFTLPAGYRPPFTCYFTSTAAGPAACLIRVEADGDVIWETGGTSTHLSLNGITFPTGWNPAAWLIPEQLNGWNWDSSRTFTDALFYVREDGWTWLRGSLDNGLVAPPVMVSPESARVAYCDVFGPLGFGQTRIDHGGGGSAGDRGAALWIRRGGSQSVVVGGLNYFSHISPESIFVTATLLNGWANYGTDHRRAYYYKDHFNVVHLLGLLQGTGKTTNTTMTLPQYYRPGKRQVFHALEQDEASSRVDIMPNGDVIAVGHTSGYLSLAHVSFRAMQ